MREAASIIEMDVERDRKTCIALDTKVTGANRELAQWLIDHPAYSGVQVAIWLNCGKTRINDLRQWAADGFQKSPASKRRERDDSWLKEGRQAATGSAGQETLETLDNSDEEEEPAADPVGLILAITGNAADKANIAIRNLEPDFTDSDRAKIAQAIDVLIRKWSSVKRKVQARPKEGAI